MEQRRKLIVGVCEDEEEDRGKTVEYLTTAFQEIDICMECKLYQDGRELLEEIKRGREYDFVILDVFMEQTGGMETAKRIREFRSQIQISFITTSKDYAIQAFELDAFHYLIKPVTLEKVRALVNRYLDRVQCPINLVRFYSSKKVYSFPVEIIFKIQSENRGVRIYLKKGSSLWIPVPFAKVAYVRTKGFLKVSRGLYVNMEEIREMKNDACVLSDGVEVLLSRTKKIEIKERYKDFLFNKILKEER